MKALVLSTAIATFAAIAAASAQPFDMSRDQADRVTAGSGGDFNVRVFKSVQEENLRGRLRSQRADSLFRLGWARRCSMSRIMVVGQFESIPIAFGAGAGFWPQPREKSASCRRLRHGAPAWQASVQGR